MMPNQTNQPQTSFAKNLLKYNLTMEDLGLAQLDKEITRAKNDTNEILEKEKQKQTKLEAYIKALMYLKESIFYEIEESLRESLESSQPQQDKPSSSNEQDKETILPSEQDKETILKSTSVRTAKLISEMISKLT